MLYELKRGRVGIVTHQELEDDYVMYSFPEWTVSECIGSSYNFRSNIYVSHNLIFVVLDIINLFNVFGDKNRIALYIRNDLVLVVVVNDHDDSIRRTFDKTSEHYLEGKGIGETVPEKFLCRFLDHLLSDDRRFLENMEINMSLLETRILKEKVEPAVINEILSIKKELMYIWNYYDQLIDLGEILRDNETDMFPDENIKGFEVFTKRTIRLSDNVKHLKEYTVQLQETHDAMLNYDQNSIMKLFTVITTIFLPLSLIAGWYGMNFVNMPELTWRYGYAGIILCSVLIVAGSFIVFKKYKLI